MCKPTQEVIDELNTFGKEGWEVIQYVENNTRLGDKLKDASYFILLKRQTVEHKIQLNG